MDKLLDVIKEKLESPVLMNYFLGLILFNRKVIYVALSTDYNDKVGHFYLYNGNMYTSKVEMLTDIYINENILGYSNTYFWPVIYAIAIAILLPYIKSLFKAVHDNAEKVFYEWIRIKMNKLETVSNESHQKLENDFLKSLKEKMEVEKEVGELTKLNSQYNQQFKEDQNEKIAMTTNVRDRDKNITQLKAEIESLNNTIINNSPPIASIFSGIWRSNYSIQNQNIVPQGGTEYIKIINQCEMHASSTIDGEYKLKWYIDRYRFYKDRIITGENNLNSIAFKKSLFNELDPNNSEEYSIGNYTISNINLIKGEEIHTIDGGKTNYDILISFTKVIDY